MREFDVVVVGGGPTGAVAARLAAEAEASVLLLERRRDTAEPSACAGLVSPRTLSVLGVSEACVLRRLRDVAFHAPGGAALSLHATSDRAFVIDRSILESELLSRAREAGVEVRLGAEATAWSDGVVRFRSPSEADAAASRVLVGADGPESRVAAWSGLRGTARHLWAAQAEVEVASDVGAVDVYVGRRIAPGFFAWSVPAQAGRVRVGVAVPPPADPALHLDRLLAAQSLNAREIARVRGAIPIPNPSDAIARDDVLLVGDAAGHVKPLSGGGLYFGGLCARVAGRAAAAAAADPGARSEHLRRYEETCRRLLGPEMRFGESARAIRDALADSDWDALFALLDRPDLVALVEEHVDIDHLRFMATRVVSHPRLWRMLLDVWAVVHARVREEGGVAEAGGGLL